MLRLYRGLSPPPPPITSDGSGGCVLCSRIPVTHLAPTCCAYCMHGSALRALCVAQVRSDAHLRPCALRLLRHVLPRRARRTVDRYGTRHGTRIRRDGAQRAGSLLLPCVRYTFARLHVCTAVWFAWVLLCAVHIHACARVNASCTPGSSILLWFWAWHVVCVNAAARPCVLV